VGKESGVKYVKMQQTTPDKDREGREIPEEAIDDVC